MTDKEMAERLLRLADLSTAEAMARRRSRSWGSIRITYPTGHHAVTIHLSGVTLSITKRWFRVLNGPRKTILLVGPLSAEEGIRQVHRHAELLRRFTEEDGPAQLGRLGG